uniref:Structural protein VP1 n=1 Tax=Hamaparvovirinae sp. TaxID=2809447 RepID=A0AAU7P1E2_9VIRU
MTSVSYSNTWMGYWENNPYIYPENKPTYIGVFSNGSTASINTGWHIIPTMLWKHFVTPKQWADMCINYEAYHVTGFDVTVYNPVPMTTQLAIQGTTAFTAFNNTIYSMGCTDEYYETSYYNWYDRVHGMRLWSAMYKEGQYRNVTSWVRTILPIYNWAPPLSRINNVRVWGPIDTSNTYRGDGTSTWPLQYESGSTQSVPSGVIWDPLNEPESIMELRPGKNAMSYSWNAHECDSERWFNIDQIAKWWPYTHDSPARYNGQMGLAGTTRLSAMDDPDRQTSRISWKTSGQNIPKDDFTIPNLLEMPIVPVNWWWQEMQKSIAENVDIQKTALHWAGTEFEQYKYPPKQCFIKGLPLFDENGTHVKTTTQGCFRVTLHLKCKPRRSKIYAPTWGPYNWQQLYSGGYDAEYHPNMVRYRTAGARRTWTNYERSALTSQINSEREDPYIHGSSYGSTASTYTVTNTIAK